MNTELGICTVCGCDDHRACIDASGRPCHWVAPGLCSNCASAWPLESDPLWLAPICAACSAQLDPWSEAWRVCACGIVICADCDDHQPCDHVAEMIVPAGTSADYEHDGFEEYERASLANNSPLHTPLKSAVERGRG